MVLEKFFSDIAVLSVTLAGFGAVVGALREPRQPWKPNELAGIKLIVEHSLAGVTLGLLPTLLTLFFAKDATIWALLSIILASFLIIEILANIIRIKAASGQGAPPRYFPSFLATWFVPSVAIFVIQIINVLVWRGQAAFAVGMVWLVFAGSKQFLLFVWYMSPKEKSDRGAPAATRKS